MEQHLHSHTTSEVKHHKEIHSFYMFVLLAVLGIVVLQPVALAVLMVLSQF